MITRDNIISKLRTVKPELSELGVSDVGLFGSYSQDRQTDESDIDILIDFLPERENFDNYMAVYDLFENLFENIRVEIVTRNGLSKHIGPEILSTVIYV